MTKNIAIFASGSGSNAENLIRYFEEKETISVRLIIANRSKAPVLDRAKRLGVPSEMFLSDEWQSEGENILTTLQKYKIDFIVLAGFLAHVPDAILQTYPNKIINIHPSLLPKYGGKGMYGDRVHEAVVAAGEKETGITIHYLNERYDEGEIIRQITCPVLPQDTPIDVAAKVHALEYEWYPRVVEYILMGNLKAQPNNMEETKKREGKREGARRKKTTCKRYGFNADAQISSILESVDDKTEFIYEAILELAKAKGIIQ